MNTHLGSKILTKPMLFEWVVINILRQEYLINQEINNNFNTKYDYITTNNIKIKIIYSPYNKVMDLLSSIKNYVNFNSLDALDHTIFITNVTNTRNDDNFISNNSMIGNNEKKIYILTLENLLYLCKYDSAFQSTLIMCLNFSTENIIPQSWHKDIDILLEGCKKKIFNQKYQNFNKPCELELKSIPTGNKNFSKYEKFCAEFIKKIFQDNLGEIKTQKITNEGLYRFDLIAPLKDDPVSFWKFIYDKFNSSFILFECKNYDEEIGQNEIYLTERYLYDNALRNVAIILSRKGINKNAKIACQGILKEHGKLILVLKDEDLYKLDERYNQRKLNKNFESPSEYMLNIARNFLLNLDK